MLREPTRLNMNEVLYCDDLAPSASDHSPGYALAEEEDVVQVHLDDGPPVFQAELIQWRAAVHPGVVDQDVDRTDSRSIRAVLRSTCALSVTSKG